MFDFVTNSIIKGISSLDSKYFHINVHESGNVTLQFLTITAPEDSHNTDGTHIGSSFGITINHTTQLEPETIVFLLLVGAKTSS